MSDLKSFVIGGFECSDHINRSGKRVNMLAETGHSEHFRQHYEALAEMGITTAREGLSWSRVDKGGGIYDFSFAMARMNAAREFGIQLIWDICHFGYPDGLFPTHPLFDDRFAKLCHAFAKFHRIYSGEQLIVIPINEISFLAWHSGEVRGTVPFATNSGFDMKYHLCKAAIKGIRALREGDPECKVLQVEPLIHIHITDAGEEEEVARLNEEQFQALDMLGGYICPELGGEPSNLEMLGFNYYYNNQWFHNGRIIDWISERHMLRELSSLLQMAYLRYDKPLLLSETGHFGPDPDKADWIQYISAECSEAAKTGVEISGVCIYPVIDRPDWDDLASYSNCGMWQRMNNGELKKDDAYCHAIAQLGNNLLKHKTMVLTSN